MPRNLWLDIGYCYRQPYRGQIYVRVLIIPRHPVLICHLHFLVRFIF